MNMPECESESMQAQCSECMEPVESDATTCSNCGFSPANEGALARRLCSGIGYLLTATIVGAPVGIPMILLSYLVGKSKENQTPANPSV